MLFGCVYIDPNPISNLNNEGHNYFLSQNPYILNSYASFGEVYYNIAQDLKLTGGLRWTEDQKHFTDIPSELIVPGYGYTATGVVNQQWDQFTGRAAVNWTPKFDFTDQTLGLRLLCPWLQSRGRQSAGGHFSEIVRTGNECSNRHRSYSSTDLQARIR